MSSKKAIVHLEELHLTWRQLNDVLSKDELAAISILSYAVTELNTLRRTFLCLAADYESDKAIRAVQSIQAHVFMRIVSSKLFEVTDFLRDISLPKSDCGAEVVGLSKDALRKLDELPQTKGFQVARRIRHEATNHFSLKAALKNIPYVKDDANCDLYFHKLNGNCFYPVGEEVMFGGQLERCGVSYSGPEDEGDVVADWLNWCIAANNWLEDILAEFYKKLLFDRLPPQGIRKSAYWVNPGLVADTDNVTIPVFGMPDRH